jgi:hypothetical protein
VHLGILILNLYIIYRTVRAGHSIPRDAAFVAAECVASIYLAAEGKTRRGGGEKKKKKNEEIMCSLPAN